MFCYIMLFYYCSMGFMKIKNILLLTLLISSFSINAQTLKVGDIFPNIKIKNQFNKSIQISSETKTVLFSNSKSSSKKLNSFLKNRSGDFMKNHRTHFIADVSGMPFLISKFFALPKMRKFPYDVLLISDSKNANFIPKKNGKLTVIKLTNLKVNSISFVNTTKDLISVFKN